MIRAATICWMRKAGGRTRCSFRSSTGYLTHKENLGQRDVMWRYALESLAAVCAMDGGA